MQAALPVICIQHVHMTPVVGLSERFQMVQYPNVVLQLHPVVNMSVVCASDLSVRVSSLVLPSYCCPCDSLGLLFCIN